MNAMEITAENILAQQNQKLHAQTLLMIEKLRKQREEYGYISYSEYALVRLFNAFFEILSPLDEGIESLSDLEFDFVDKSKFDADICVRIPSLLRKYKGWEYISVIIPKIKNLISESFLSQKGIISRIETVGIYVNISFSDSFLFDSLGDIFAKKSQFWESDVHRGEDVVVDYSSPNVAKHLHAGHIRSTIIGQVLANLYTATGYTTHRVNHINDRGGFWFLIEGYERWSDLLIAYENKNDLLFAIYTMYRQGEKLAKSESEFLSLSTEQLQELKKFYRDFGSYQEFVEHFNDFVTASKERFSLLEKGNPKETLLWQDMVKWSLADFWEFYDLLDIHHDYVLWESFYAEMGLNLVMSLYEKWIVKLYSEQVAQQDIAQLEKAFEDWEITDKIYEAAISEIKRDIGAYVIDFWNFERLVVLKWDKSSIYATRDLGALKYRVENYAPKKVIYEVGQEQEDHFMNLFKAARKLWIDDVDFRFVYHGFYVDSVSKKKLSSRDGASNVKKLITEAIAYFEKKYEGSQFSPEEVRSIARKLAIGSIILNDIKQDKKNPVAISSDIQEACRTFEESGGAYILYSIARAKSILAKVPDWDKPTFEEGHAESLTNLEKDLILWMDRYPMIILQAEETDNPALLVEWALMMCRLYNSYYSVQRVITEEWIQKKAYFITKAFAQVLENAMNLCHIKTPERV